MLSLLLNHRTSAFKHRNTLELMSTGIKARRVHPNRMSQPPEPSPKALVTPSGSDPDSSLNPMGFQLGFNKSAQTPNLNPNFDDETLDHYTYEQLEDSILKKIELLYIKAISQLVSSGYDEHAVLEAILRNGHCHGKMDPLTNILHNAQIYLSTADSGCNDKFVSTEKVFANLKLLREATLISLLCWLRKSYPFMSRRDAMCWLLVSDLHTIRVSSSKISNDDGDGVNTQMDDPHPNWSEPTPSMLVLLKDNADFLAAEYRSLDGDSLVADVKHSKVSLEGLCMKNQTSTKSILKRFNDLNPKDEILMSLMKEIKDLDTRINEKKKWADEKALQAAKRLCEDRNELKKLRMEKEDNEWTKKQKSPLDIDHPTMKSLIDAEMALRALDTECDHALMLMSYLEIENLEIKAEIMASKLSASESVTSIVESAKREKKHLKKILAWEKQKGKLEEDITSEKQKLVEIEEEMIQVEASKKTAEEKWREEQESKKHALARVEQEMILKEQTISDNKRIQESLHARIDLDLKCQKDDIQRLEQELSRVKSLTDPDHYRASLFGTHFGNDTIGKMLHGSSDEGDESDDEAYYECVMCGENEVSVVFLPCAHEVVCGDCNKGLKKDECPTCGVAIEQRIRVFGGSS
uniref:RING-type domain-containing protein n=2 Tax=Lactuca sativa TaxID=4236 RepID=A0A9R1V8X6_LACSA|nr:hypothetical protein LSAT_V11C600331880 [Lactuca sativa]